MSETLRVNAPPLMRDIYHAAYEGGAGAACRRMQTLATELRRPARIPVVGERSRGKSRLLNALLRRPGLLPVEVEVASNVFVVVSSIGDDEDEHVEVRFGDGKQGRRVPLDDLDEYASEVRNPSNIKGVQSVTVRIHGRSITRGIELLDTPGVGGLVSEHGSMALEATRQADGLVMVLEAAKPITKPELQFISMVTERSSDVPVVFCLTKTDMYQGKSLDEMTSFLRDGLARHAPDLSASPMVCVSALRADRSLELVESDPTRSAELGGLSGMGSLVGAIHSHILGTVERDRFAGLLEEGRRITLELAQPQRERLSVLEGGVDPQARLAEIKGQLAALPDQNALRTRLDREMQALHVRTQRKLQTQLREMNRDLRDRVEFHWKKSMRKSLPNDYDQRFQQIWLETVNDVNEGASQIATARARAYALSGGGVEAETSDAPETAGQIRRTKRAAKRIRSWMRIIVMSFMSWGLLFPVQYMEHREAMQNADKGDARLWLAASTERQFAYYDELRAHLERAGLRVLAVVEPPVLDRRRSLKAMAAALEDVTGAGGAEQIRQELDRLQRLSDEASRLLAEG